MDLWACPRCGSLEIRPTSPGQGGMWQAPATDQLCAECGFRGAPILLDDRDAWLAFRAAKAADRPAPPALPPSTNRRGPAWALWDGAGGALLMLVAACLVAGFAWSALARVAQPPGLDTPKGLALLGALVVLLCVPFAALARRLARNARPP